MVKINTVKSYDELEKNISSFLSHVCSHREKKNSRGFLVWTQLFSSVSAQSHIMSKEDPVYSQRE